MKKSQFKKMLKKSIKIAIINMAILFDMGKLDCGRVSI